MPDTITLASYKCENTLSKFGFFNYKMWHRHTIALRTFKKSMKMWDSHIKFKPYYRLQWSHFVSDGEDGGLYQDLCSTGFSLSICWCAHFKRWLGSKGACKVWKGNVTRLVRSSSKDCMYLFLVVRCWRHFYTTPVAFLFKYFKLDLLSEIMSESGQRVQKTAEKSALSEIKWCI